MSYLPYGAKAKAWMAKRKGIETLAITAGSDNGYIVALARTVSIARKVKRGKTRCEHCDWRAPASSLLHAHHVVPLSCGGADMPDNLIILCPTCHTLAHWVTSRSNLQRRYTGPAIAIELRKWIACAMQPAKLKSLRDKHMRTHLAPILSAMRA